MHLNTDLTRITSADTIIVANNRQVLAFKHTFAKQHPHDQLPKIFSWQQYLKYYWQSQQLHSELRLIEASEQRYLIEFSLEFNGQIIRNPLISEVIKNYDYCANHLINQTTLADSKIQMCEVFAQWIAHYQQNKQSLGLVDINDLAILMLKDTSSLSAPYVYGFKTLTPLQQQVFEALNYRLIGAQQINSSEQRCFNSGLDEIKAAATWAKQQQSQNPDDSIVVVCPQLSDLQHQLISTFDQIFDDQLVETGYKSYNISLGLPLSQYGLIQDLLDVLELTEQLKRNKIHTKLFNQVVRSVYIKGYQLECSTRHLLTNKVNSLVLEYFQLEQLDDSLKHCPMLLKAIVQVKSLPSIKQTLSQHLLAFNLVLSDWGFATDRNLSSSEYQLFQKYLVSALKLNPLSLHQDECSSAVALYRLKEITNQVVFQAQSSKANIQIVGSLEAEGLHFNKAWVMGMTHDFLPARLNSPRFISSHIAIHHQIPFSSYELVQADAQNTLNNLKSLADQVIFSYAKSHLESEQLPTPLLDFPSQAIDIIKTQPQVISTELINDAVATAFEESKIKSGVNLLKDQMACAFKGFSHRLNIKHYDEPHVGLDRREQGNIIHNALQYIYEELKTQEALLKLDKTELTSLISRKIYAALTRHKDSGFKTIEKTRIEQLLFKFFKAEKLRENFIVLATERNVTVNIAGLSFNTRLDRLDKMDNGDQIVFDYKTGSTSISKWCSVDIAEPQLPIYSITNKTQGAAFIELSSSAIRFKGLSKDSDSLPKQSSRKGACQTWDEQLISWENRLNQASQDFQSGQAQVLPNKIACDYCEFDLLCRIQK